MTTQCRNHCHWIETTGASSFSKMAKNRTTAATARKRQQTKTRQKRWILRYVMQNAFCIHPFYTIHFHFLNFSNEQTNRSWGRKFQPLNKIQTIFFLSLSFFLLLCKFIEQFAVEEQENENPFKNDQTTTATENEEKKKLTKRMN